ncbi:MAG: hypothetical protein AVDCRST_MAG02-1560 [uncultured Rubrobacteraceae bacterium]|uniref:Uncharacterized protein n=1 Tax=uncultured Rubrobacteraceae bacterium TaxID=349277 RepID=A0A6J4QUJ2_9ACTN|nr:MAG: hypothetical protein AVDCRST_MAG02-1560 [uncultured Rubrobacteraceae bacterium]
MLLAALLLLCTLCHGVSSLSDLRKGFAHPRLFRSGTFPTRVGPRLDPAGAGIGPGGGVYAPDSGGTKTKRRRRGAFSYGEPA